MNSRLLFSPEAQAQLDELEAHLIERAGAKVADAYMDRLLDFCDRMAQDPVAGHSRDDLLPGLRTRTFEKSRILCFVVVGEDVHIVAIFGTRQEWEQRIRGQQP